MKEDSNLSYDLNDAYTLVLDANGYVVYTDGTAGHNDYVYVAKMDYAGGAKKSLEGDAYSSTAPTRSSPLITMTILMPDYGNWYSYNERRATASTSWRLSPPIRIPIPSMCSVSTSVNKGVVTENGKSTVYVNDTNTTGSGKIDKVKANNDTIFVVNDDDDVTAYTGIKNVPTTSPLRTARMAL